MIKDVFCDLYNRPMMIFIEESQEAINVKLSEYFGQPTQLDVSKCLGLCEMLKGNGKTLLVVFLSDGNLSVENFGTIVHESVHACNDIFEYVGVELDISNDEPAAYLTDWLARQIFGALNEYHAKRC